MLRLERITKDNLDYATIIQNTIFEEYNGRNNYLDSVLDESKLAFFLLYDNDNCVGTTGIYSYKNDNDNAWLGFFGILEKYRKNGYGLEALKLTEDYAKSRGFINMRLFTDTNDNELAISFYKKRGYTFELYINDQEFLKDEFNVSIGSKSLIGKEVEPWNNKFINLTKQTLKQI